MEPKLATQPKQQAVVRQRVAAKPPLVIAHRGDSKAAPENTLPAFESALAVGAEGVELDFHHSADGIPVVIHDETLDRTTNAQHWWAGTEIPVASKALAALRQLDAGQWFADRFTGTLIPTLEEALAVIVPRAICMLERKAGDPGTDIGLLERMNVVPGVVMTSFDWDYLGACHRLSAQLALGALGEQELTDSRCRAARAVGALLVGWNQEHLTAAQIDCARAHGLLVWAWTVDEPARAVQLVQQGVSGIITNLPALMKQTLETIGG